MHETDQQLFLPGGLPVFINAYSVPFLSYYMLILLIDPHKQFLFAAGKTPLGPSGHLIHDSTFMVLGRFHISGACK